MRQRISKLAKAARQAVLLSVVLAATGVLVAPAARAAQCQATEASKNWYDKYMAATEAGKKGDYPTAIADIKGSINAATQSCEKVGAMQKYRELAYNSHNWQELVNAAEMMNASEAVSAKDKTANLLMISNAQQQLRHLDKALPPLKEYIKQTGGTPAELNNLAELEHNLGDCPGALQAIDKATGGKNLNEQQLLIQADCYFKSKDAAKRLPVMEQLAVRFPKKNYFMDLLALYQLATPPIDDRALLNLYRLGYQRDYVSSADDILHYAKLADSSGASNEALRVIDKSVEKKKFSLDDKSKNLEAQEKRASTEDSTAVAQLDKESQAGKNGDKDVKVGMIYFGLEQYPAAIAALSRGLAPDHVARVQRPDDANMALGIAYARTKKFAEAEKAFQAAKADPRMAKAADLWLAMMKG